MFVSVLPIVSWHSFSLWQRRADPAATAVEHKGGPSALASTVTLSAPVGGGSDYERAATALREASSALKLHLQAFDMAYTQLVTAIVQVRDSAEEACHIYTCIVQR